MGETIRQRLVTGARTTCRSCHGKARSRLFGYWFWNNPWGPSSGLAPVGCGSSAIERDDPRLVSDDDAVALRRDREHLRDRRQVHCGDVEPGVEPEARALGNRGRTWVVPVGLAGPGTCTRPPRRAGSRARARGRCGRLAGPRADQAAEEREAGRGRTRSGGCGSTPGCTRRPSSRHPIARASAVLLARLPELPHRVARGLPDDEVPVAPGRAACAPAGIGTPARRAPARTSAVPPWVSSTTGTPG